MTNPWKPCGALRILRVDGRRLWAGRGLELLEGAVDDAGELSWRSAARAPGGSLSRAAARGRRQCRVTLQACPCHGVFQGEQNLQFSLCDAPCHNVWKRKRPMVASK